MKDQPHVVATTFHISQGLEIAQCETVGDGVSVTIDIGRVAEGAVWLALPARPSAVRLNGEALPDKAIRAIASGVWAVTCRIAGTGVLSVDWSDRRSA